MSLRLQPPRAADAAELLAFESDNRAFFEATINARPTDYYLPGGVPAAIEAAQRAAASDSGYQYLVRDAAGQLLARVNLSRVRRAHFHSAELGYRVAQRCSGRGIASEAVRLLLTEAFGALGLQRIEAAAHEHNLASQRVLARNGFSAFGRSRRSFELHGQWLDTLHFERHATP